MDRTAGSQTSGGWRSGSGWLLTATLCFLAFAARQQGCETDDSQARACDEYDCIGLIESLATAVIQPQYVAFSGASESLQDAVANWQASVNTDEGPAARLAAQDAWRAAMFSWQRCELHQVGPAASESKPGGEGVRDSIYSWPTLNACRVDQELVSGDYESESFFEDELVNVQGLDALEYLLFVEGDSNDCPPFATINSEGSWATMGTATLAQRRADYALACAGELVSQALYLADTWNPESGAYGAILSGQTGDVFSDATEGIDLIFAGLFYLEKQVKDAKLSPPLGIKNCDESTCPDDLESPWAHHSLENVQANVEGFSNLFFGGPAGSDAMGFDDFLLARGEEELANAMGDALSAVSNAIGGIEEDALTSLTADPGALNIVHEKLAAVTTLLKGSVSIALLLEVPSEAANDND